MTQPSDPPAWGPREKPLLPSKITTTMSRESYSRIGVFMSNRRSPNQRNYLRVAACYHPQVDERLSKRSGEVQKQDERVSNMSMRRLTGLALAAAGLAASAFALGGAEASGTSPSSRIRWRCR